MLHNIIIILFLPFDLYEKYKIAISLQLYIEKLNYDKNLQVLAVRMEDLKTMRSEQEMMNMLIVLLNSVFYLK
ncbi:hypothetical protein [Bacillus pseudomycoides]|uniref:hypothetical protein n=1 Tax=Bacillus pseudomycoides TaxID=64104 RepID=UPI000BF341D2|nr:hypothetical protein [Bacillus pseudomycoides]